MGIKRHLQSLCASTLVLAACVCPALTHADPLSDLNNSVEMQKFNSGARGDDLYSKRYFKLDSNLASLFISPNGYANAQNWIAPAEGGFTGGPITGLRMPEYIEALRTFTSAKGSEVIVRILVPHPKFAPMLKYGLIRPFNELEPTAIDFVNTESIDIRGVRADLYVFKDKACMLLMRTARSTVVQLQQSECAGLNTLVTLAELLDLKRLERKLES